MTKTKNIKVTPDELMRRVLSAKGKFMLSNYMPVYEYVFGVQTDEQKKEIGQVWNLRKTDLKITERFEYMVTHSKNN